jgi:hypothetical protein
VICGPLLTEFGHPWYGSLFFKRRRWDDLVPRSDKSRMQRTTASEATSCCLSLHHALNLPVVTRPPHFSCRPCVPVLPLLKKKAAFCYVSWGYLSCNWHLWCVYIYNLISVVNYWQLIKIHSLKVSDGASFILVILKRMFWVFYVCVLTSMLVGVWGHSCDVIHLLYNWPFESVIITAKSPWRWHGWCIETCWRIDSVWRIRLKHIKLILKVIVYGKTANKVKSIPNLG